MAGILAAMNKIKAKTAETESRKRGIAKCLNSVRSIIFRKMEEASENKRGKRERIRTRLTEVVRQVKTAKEKEFADFMQYIEHKYNQIRDQLEKKSRLAARGEARVGQSTTTSYQHRAAGELLDNKSAQLEIF